MTGELPTDNSQHGKWFRYTDGDKEDWNQFAARARAPLFLFNRSFMEYHSDRFEDWSMLYRDGKSIVTILPASRHGDVVVSHGGLTYGGFLLSSAVRGVTLLNAVSQLFEDLHRIGVKRFVYKAVPYIFFRQPAQDDIFVLHKLGAKLVRRDLSSIIHLEDRGPVSSGRKWGVKKARREGLSVSRSTDWVRFHQILLETLQKHEATPVHSVEELSTLAHRFPENIHLYIVETDGDMIAATLVFEFEGVVHTQYITASEKGRDVGALDILIEEVIQLYQRAGKKYFSFGISTEKQGTVLNEGLLYQKEGFGARGLAVDFYEVDLTRLF